VRQRRALSWRCAKASFHLEARSSASRAWFSVASSRPYRNRSCRAVSAENDSAAGVRPPQDSLAPTLETLQVSWLAASPGRASQIGAALEIRSDNLPICSRSGIRDAVL